MQKKVGVLQIELGVYLLEFLLTVEIATLTRQDDSKTVIKVLPGTEVDKLISTYYEEEERKKEEKAKEEKAKQEKASTS